MDNLLFRDSVEESDVVHQGYGGEGPDLVLLGDSSKRVDGGGVSVKGVELPSVQGQCRGA